MDNIVANLPFILLAIAMVVLQYFLRKRRGPAGTQQEIVQNLLAEARLDLRMAEVFDFSPRAKRFMTTTWQLNKNKLDFLDKSLQDSVSNAFMMAEDVNQQIAAAKKYKSTSYLVSVDIDKLKGLLSKSQEGLEQWLLLKVGSKNPAVKAPGLFDDLLGKR
ncbi:MAG: hypothetical protein HYX80_01230 [Chloroflexi bacterium]|nr:hypothetical protein [Chloroflexota bacterium]